MASKRLYVTDLDGTLLGADSRVSERSAALLRDAIRRGALVTAATARTPATVVPLLADTGIHLPVVVLTGAAIWDMATHRYLSATLLDPAYAALLTDLVARHALFPMVYTLAGDGCLDMWADRASHPSAERFIAERSTLALKRVHRITTPLGYLERPDVMLLLATGTPDDVQRAAAELRAATPLSVSAYSDPVYPGVAFLEVFGPGVSKAQGLQRLQRLTGADSVTVFGDSANDIPMMHAADRAIAVANAADEVKHAADMVIGANTDDAVPQYICNDLLTCTDT